MPPFTPEQEARIAEIVRAAIFEVLQQDADEAARIAKSFDRPAPAKPYRYIVDSAPPEFYAPPVGRYQITASELILDAKLIIATVPIEVRPAPDTDPA